MFLINEIFVLVESAIALPSLAPILLTSSFAGGVDLCVCECDGERE